MSYRVVIASSRNFSDFKKLTTVMDDFLKQKNEVEIWIGGARSDKLAEDYAYMGDYRVRKFLPEWSKGKNVAVRRNEVPDLLADACVCFWEGGNSGTAHMIQVASKNFLRLTIVEFT